MGRGAEYLAAFGLVGLILSGAGTTTAADKTSLYERLGGKAGITNVIDRFVANVGNDARINQRFATTDLSRLKRLLVEQVCQGTGGPCQYTGRDMKTTHAGMGITTADFNALVEDLVKALDHYKVPKAEQKDLLAILGPMKTDIVEVPDHARLSR